MKNVSSERRRPSGFATAFVLAVVIVLVFALTAIGGYYYLEQQAAERDSAARAPAVAATTGAAGVSATASTAAGNTQSASTSAAGNTVSADAVSTTGQHGGTVDAQTGGTALPAASTSGPAAIVTGTNRAGPQVTINSNGPAAIITGQNAVQNNGASIAGDLSLSAEASNDSQMSDAERRLIQQQQQEREEAQQQAAQQETADTSDTNDEPTDEADANDPDAEETETESNEDTLSIAGRVLNQTTGAPIPGIALKAKPLGSHGLKPRNAVSDADGNYRITGLAQAEYGIETTATGRYAKNAITVRAGLQTADLTLREITRFALQGRVTRPDGSPVAGITVRPSGEAKAATTNDEGFYQTSVTVPVSATVSVSTSGDGYEPGHTVIPASQSEGVSVVEHNITVTPKGAGSLYGTVGSDIGDLLTGVTLSLSSNNKKTRYHASSTTDGTFRFENVTPAEDYVLIAKKPGVYKTASVQNIIISGGGPQSVDIAMQSASTGRISGSMVDALGNPVPNFSMLVTSNGNGGTAKNVTADESGYFVVDSLVAGNVSFLTRSAPILNVTGLKLEPGGDLSVQVVLDWGNYAFEGTVVSTDGAPVAGAHVSVKWTHQNGDTRSTMVRSVRTDNTGLFRISEIGPGEHTVTISASGFATLPTTLDPEKVFEPQRYTLEARQ